MINRKAYLYKDFRKIGEPLGIVNVLIIGVDSNGDGYSLVAAIERQNGDVEEIDPSRLRFVTPTE